MDIKEEQSISSRIMSGLSTAQENRKRGQWNIDNWVDYWRAVSTNPTNQWYDTNEIRTNGTLTSSQNNDPSMRVSINYIAQEVINMVASDLLNPLRWRVRLRFFDPDQQIELKQFEDNQPIKINPDKYLDRINDVLNDYLSRDKLNINDARLRLYNLRYKEGSAYWTLDWDDKAGPRSVFPKRKNEEKWDVLSGEWSKDGQFFKIPRPPLKMSLEEYEQNITQYPPLTKAPVQKDGVFEVEIPQDDEMIPSSAFNGENFKEDVIPQGDPCISVYGVKQVWWELEPGEISMGRVHGVYILDYISEAQARQDYGEKDIYGVKETIDLDYLITKEKDLLEQIKGLFKSKSEKDLLRIRYRRKPNPGERRSQWFTLINGKLVKASECPYGKSFDVSLGIYPLFARPSGEHLEGIPDIAYMYQPQIFANAIDSLILEYIESFPYGTYTAPGGDEPNTNVTSGGGPKIITSDRPLTQNTPIGLGQEVFTMKSDMRYMIQYFGRSNQLQPGTRSQDANTATQASIAQSYGQKLTSFNQFNDAGSWQLFLNDLLSLLGQFVKERRKIRTTSMVDFTSPDGTTQIDVGEKFDFTSDYLEYVDYVVCEPEDLQRKTDEESKRDLTAMLALVNPADPYEIEFGKKLKRRYVELMNESGIEYPDEVMVPGTNPGNERPLGDGGPGLAKPDQPTDVIAPQNMPVPQQQVINQI